MLTRSAGEAHLELEFRLPRPLAHVIGEGCQLVSEPQLLFRSSVPLQMGVSNRTSCAPLVQWLSPKSKCSKRQEIKYGGLEKLTQHNSTLFHCSEQLQPLSIFKSQLIDAKKVKKLWLLLVHYCFGVKSVVGNVYIVRSHTNLGRQMLSLCLFLLCVLDSLSLFLSISLRPRGKNESPIFIMFKNQNEKIMYQYRIKNMLRYIPSIPTL